MKICVDPGHGGSDPGAVGRVPYELMEKDANLSIALILEQALIDKGHSVYMTRRIDRTLSLPARSNYANRKNVELFASVHCNSAANTTAEGIETWIYPSSQTGRSYAQNVQSSLVETFPDHKDRGVKEANFHVLRETNMPAILVECEFISNADQLVFLSNGENQQKIAEAIASVI